MIVRALDVNYDWTFGKGKNDYLQARRAVQQNIRTRLLSFLGDCFFNIEAGIDWFNLLGSKNQIALNLAVSTVLLNTDGVTSILQLELDLDRRTRDLTISYAVTIVAGITNTGPFVVSGAVDLILTEDGISITTESGEAIETEGDGS